MHCLEHYYFNLKAHTILYTVGWGKGVLFRNTGIEAKGGEGVVLTCQEWVVREPGGGWLGQRYLSGFQSLPHTTFPEAESLLSQDEADFLSTGPSEIWQRLQLDHPIFSLTSGLLWLSSLPLLGELVPESKGGVPLAQEFFLWAEVGWCVEGSAGQGWGWGI